jgi:CRISPR/Cas system CSM-associated protein Csm3 (group 7 of RAMP superfamily)
MINNMAHETYKIQIQLLSDTLIGATEGYGAIIDKDSVYDEVGLPIIPGKRIKGILRAEAELLNKFHPIAIKQKNNNNKTSIEFLFGDAGITNKNTEYLSVSNFVLPDYEANKTYLKYLTQEEEISRSEVIAHFTTIRMMTRIDEDGIAENTSLRTFRVLKKGLVFEGELTFDSDYLDEFKNIVALTRRIGSMRNRGLGQIQCRLIENSKQNVKPEKIALQ